MAKQKKGVAVTRESDFPEWYQQVIKEADLAENSPVRGCMIVKPNGYAVWENMQQTFDKMIKALDVQNAYFPLLIPLRFISKEAEHVDGFAKECAVVTHHRLEKSPDGGLQPAEGAKLEEPYIIRPTSETIIGDAMARWINSYRDLPMKLNQWANVMRWEMRPRVFLRTSEFLWQEGHNAFANAEDCLADAKLMLDTYAEFVREHLAIPVIPGEKTPDERFPGAVNTFTIEAMMQDGKALQAGTTHFLGQNFAKSCDISYQDQQGTEQLAFTNSWGISTRLIGALIMVHGDDDGIIVPPRIAPVQVGIVPFIRKDDGKEEILAFAGELVAKLKALGVRVKLDDSDKGSGDKTWAMIKQGVPIRVEIGKREVAEGKLSHVRRDIGRDSKTSCTQDEFVANVLAMLDDIHASLYKRAEQHRDAHIVDVQNLEQAKAFFAEGRKGLVRMDAALVDEPAYAEIQDEYAVTSRCLPFADEGRKVIIGKAY